MQFCVIELWHMRRVAAVLALPPLPFWPLRQHLGLCRSLDIVSMLEVGVSLVGHLVEVLDLRTHNSKTRWRCMHLCVRDAQMTPGCLIQRQGITGAAAAAVKRRNHDTLSAITCAAKHVCSVITHKFVIVVAFRKDGASTSCTPDGATTTPNVVKHTS
jgi:hypothetical protein